MPTNAPSRISADSDQRVVAAAQLGRPEADTEVGEQREGRHGLFDVAERSLHLADHDGVEVVVALTDTVEERRGGGASLPRHRPRLAESWTTSTMVPPWAVTSCSARERCQARESAGNCKSSVVVRAIEHEPLPGGRAAGRVGTVIGACPVVVPPVTIPTWRGRCLPCGRPYAQGVRPSLDGAGSSRRPDRPTASARVADPRFAVTPSA